MGSTTKKALRWPTPTVGVKPNVAQDIRNLAEDIDAALANPTSIGGTDLNAITATGFYQGNNLGNAPLGSANTFFVHALYRDSGTQVQTAYNMSDGTRWGRGTASGTWKGWTQILDDSFLPKIGIDRTDPGTAAFVDDWNNATLPGAYRISGGSNTNPNSPTGSYKFGMLTVSTTLGGGVVQMYVSDAQPTRTVYVREKWQASWGNWAQVQTVNDTGWSLTPIVPASGWGNKTDPKLNASGTVVGGVRNLNGFVEYRFQLTRTSATAVTSSASGNIGGDPVIATVNPATYPQFVPSSIVDDAFDVIGVQAGVARIDDAGQITISALYPNDTINQNDVIQVSLRFLAG